MAFNLPEFGSAVFILAVLHYAVYKLHEPPCKIPNYTSSIIGHYNCALRGCLIGTKSQSRVSILNWRTRAPNCTKDWLSRISIAPVSPNFRYETKFSKMPQGCTNRHNSNRKSPHYHREENSDWENAAQLWFDWIPRHYKTPLNMKIHCFLCCYCNARRFVSYSYDVPAYEANEVMWRASCKICQSK